MSAVSDAGLLVGSVGPVAPVANRAPRPDRTVEGSARTRLETEDQRGMFASSAAVLQLLERSVAQYAEILELASDDPPAADVATGLHAQPTTDTGNHTDVYA